MTNTEEVQSTEDESPSTSSIVLGILAIIISLLSIGINIHTHYEIRNTMHERCMIYYTSVCESEFRRR